MRSKKLLDAYRSIRYWLDGYDHALWYRGREVLTTDAQRNALREAEFRVMEAQKILDDAFGPEIGKAMISEIRK